MARWLLVPLGLAVAATAAWLLLGSPGDPPSPPSAPVASGPAARAKAEPHPATSPRDPEGHIDAASRRQLERVLEDEGLGR